MAWPSSLEPTLLSGLAARAVLAAKALCGAIVALGAAAWATAAPVEVTVTDAAGQPLPDAVVFVDSNAARAAAKPMSGVEVVQQDKRFQPEVSVVTVGTPVAFPNRDTVRHHVYSFSPAKRFELKLYVGTPAAPVVFDKPGVSVLGCNIHDQMVAWVLILETPWYTRTDAQGRARLPEVPAGTHQLRAWHAALPVGAPASSQALSVDNTPVRAQVRLGVAAR